ncbi:MAG: hypothetical protein ABJB74_15380 [Gemmatimonas sp.]
MSSLPHRRNCSHFNTAHLAATSNYSKLMHSNTNDRLPRDSRLNAVNTFSKALSLILVLLGLGVVQGFRHGFDTADYKLLIANGVWGVFLLSAYYCAISFRRSGFRWNWWKSIAGIAVNLVYMTWFYIIGARGILPLYELRTNFTIGSAISPLCFLAFGMVGWKSVAKLKTRGHHIRIAASEAEQEAMRVGSAT